jgi:hypothetical protein
MSRRSALFVIFVVTLFGVGCHYCGPRPFGHWRNCGPVVAGPGAYGGAHYDVAPVALAPSVPAVGGSPHYVDMPTPYTPLHSPAPSMGGGTFVSMPSGPSCGGCGDAGHAATTASVPAGPRYVPYGGPAYPGSHGVGPQPIYPGSYTYPPSGSPGFPGYPGMGSESLGPPTIMPPPGTGPKVEILPQPMPKPGGK